MNEDQRAIRVMHVASGDLWAGAEAQVAELVGALAKRPEFELAAILLNEGELANRLRKAGVETRVFPEAHANAWSIYAHMVAFMRTWRPDVAHTHRQKENVLGALAARAARVPVCVRTAHGAPEFSPSPQTLHKHALRRLDAWAAKHRQQRVVAVADDLADKLRHELPGASICVIPNGIDVDAVRLTGKSPVALPADVFHVAFVGRLVPVKRVDVILRAAAELLRDGREKYRFHIIGDGPLRPDNEKLAFDLGITNCCEFHGFQSDAPRWLAAMDCLVLTSNHEGLPMAALEARALGVPIVAHAVGGLIPLLQGASDCRLVPNQEPGAIANAIRSAAATTIKCSMSRLPERYRVESTMAEYVQLYRSLLNQTSR